MTVVYADSLFLINTVVDYLMILVTGRLAGIPLQRKRFLLAALLGGTYGVAAIIPGASFLLSPVMKVLVWILITLTAYGRSQLFLRLTLLLGVISCALAGVVFALGSFWSTALLDHRSTSNMCLCLLCAVCAGLLCIPMFRSAAQTGVSGTTLPVRVSIGGRDLEIMALLDTGNQLRDPWTGEAVLVVSLHALQGVLPASLKKFLSPEAFCSPIELVAQIHDHAPELCPKLLPYRALGVPSGTLLALRTDWIRIRNVTYPHATLALAPVDFGLGYSALWGGTWKGETETHGSFEKNSAVDVEATVLQGSGLLHRG